MDTYVEDKDVLFNQVFAHLNEVEQHPDSSKLDEELLRRAERALDASTPRELQWRILQEGEQLLQTLQQDPRPLTRLLEKDIQLIPFDELKSSITVEKLEEGIKSPSNPIKTLCLAYVAKAADNPSGAAFVAASSSLVQLLVTTWLTTDNTEVSERAVESLILLLAVDNPESTTMVAAGNRFGEVHGGGLMWRRVFHDAQVYVLFFTWTSLVKPSHDLKTKKGQRDVTISQGRLFDFLARIAQFDWTAITTSSLPGIERQFVKTNTNDQPYGGLLRYAASSMIDPEDIIMEALREDLFIRLLQVAREEGSQRLPPRLLEAIEHETDQPLEQSVDGMHL